MNVRAGHRRRGLGVAGLVMLSLVGAGCPGSQTGTAPAATAASLAARTALRAEFGVTAVDDRLPGIERWVLSGNVGQIRDRLGARTEVAYAEPNYLRTLQAFTPDERQPSSRFTYYTTAADQGGTPFSGVVDQWYLDSDRGIGIDKAWAWFVAAHPTLVPGEGVTVAVVDTGIDVDHPDLAGRIATDSTGAKRFVDTVGSGSEARDLNGHGTHVAGLIAAASNHDGIVGVAPGAALLPVRVMTPQGNAANDFDLARGIEAAAEAGVDVINFSVGGPEPSQILDDALAVANARGVTVVCAAGNYQEPVFYPAASPGVIAVGATAGTPGRPLDIPSYSCFGPELALVAPGGTLPGDAANQGILSCLPTYANFSSTQYHKPLSYGSEVGTSMATPLVAGVAALVISDAKARGVRLTPSQVRTRLIATARPVGGAAFDVHSGYGLVDPLQALKFGGPGGSAK